jgi:glycosyltransferase involved in cell wall biosynthesis
VKVAVDARHLDGGRGVAEYTRGMLDALSGVDLAPIGRAGRTTYLAAALTGRPRLDRLAGGDPDVVWAPAPAPLAVSAGIPFVLTIHDLSWVQRPQDFTPYERAWHAAGRLRRLARRADRVVVDAAATIEPLIGWGVDRDRIRVVHPGVPQRHAGELPPGTPERYVLFVGALEPRKDPELLVKAHARSQIDADLVFAGAGRLAPRLKGERIHVIDPIDHDQLGALYAGALALAMPSHLEGFGFPPLEAALHGTPSVVSDLPVFDETLGDTAIKTPPGDEHALAAALQRLTDDAALRDDLGARARQRAQHFTWGSAAAELRAVLEEVAR